MHVFVGQALFMTLDCARACSMGYATLSCPGSDSESRPGSQQSRKRRYFEACPGLLEVRAPGNSGAGAMGTGVMRRRAPLALPACAAAAAMDVADVAGGTWREGKARV